MSKILRTIPFIVVIGLSILAEAAKHKINMLTPYILVGATILLITLTIVLLQKKKDYFVIAISSVALIGQGAVFVFPPLGQFYLHHIIGAMYFGMLLMATIPLFLGIKPFCFSISAKGYPAPIVNSHVFFKLNNLMSIIWACIFTLLIIFTSISYSNNVALQMVLSILIPIMILIFVGVPITKYLPTYLMQNVKSEPIVFSSIADAFEGMPFGLNKELAKNIDVVIQFELTGKEPGIHHLIIKDQKCFIGNGAHISPDTTIKSDSQVWLDITNNILPGDKAFINKMFEIEGDATIFLIFADLFRPKAMQDIEKYIPREMNFPYKRFEQGKIQKIVVFDGGPRNKKYSKTTFMVDKFIDGAKNAGATVDYFKLNKYKINHCTGCFTCWTKTPGECIFQDDMTLLREKYREANLVIFASPLYIFSVTGILKTFMDRLLPLMKPYMLQDDTGQTIHPDRFPEMGEQGFVVFSSGGFPEIEHNFDGLQAMFRCWDSHNENSYLMGEFFMSASELIVQDVYKNRQDEIAKSCYLAGEEAVKFGKIDKAHMQTVSFAGVSQARFQEQANYFWETLDGKESYLQEVPHITTSGNDQSSSSVTT